MRLFFSFLFFSIWDPENIADLITPPSHSKKKNRIDKHPYLFYKNAESWKRTGGGSNSFYFIVGVIHPQTSGPSTIESFLPLKNRLSVPRAYERNNTNNKTRLISQKKKKKKIRSFCLSQPISSKYPVSFPINLLPHVSCNNKKKLES